MNKRHRSTSLRYFTKHCPAALGFYEARAPMDREFFQVGIAAHAVLQALGEHTKRKGRWPDDNGNIGFVANAAAAELCSSGRSFDGDPEPPMNPDDAFAGRDLALAWVRDNPMSPGASHEVGLGITADGTPCAYSSDDARYVAILDMLEPIEIGDEEYTSTAMVITEYKTAWPTDATELDTVQCRGQVVLVAAMYRNTVAVIVQRVVNLRTRQVFERTIDLEGDAAMLDQWRGDLMTLCDAADETRTARPGAGCGGCPWASVCNDAWGAVRNPRDAATCFAVADAIRADLFAKAKIACKESPVPIPDGEVGYHGKEARKPADDAAILIAELWHGENSPEWRAQNAAWLGLLEALDIGQTQVTKAAKAIYPGRDDKTAREELIEQLTVPTVRQRIRGYKILMSARWTMPELTTAATYLRAGMCAGAWPRCCGPRDTTGRSARFIRCASDTRKRGRDMKRNDDLTATTWINWEEETADGEDFATMESRVRWTFSPLDPGVSTGPVERCYPPEGGEVLECTVVETYNPDTDKSVKGLDLDGEEFMQARGIDFERETERAWVEAQRDES